MSTPNADSVRPLLADFIEAKTTLADGHSSDIYGSYRQIISDAKDRAAALGVEWDDSLVPDYVRDLLRWDDEATQIDSSERTTITQLAEEQGNV